MNILQNKNILLYESKVKMRKGDIEDYGVNEEGLMEHQTLL